MKTILQLANEIGVSKQAIRNQIAKLGLQSNLQKNGNQFAINKQQEISIKQAFNEKTQSENAKQMQSETEITLQFSLRLLEQEVEFLRSQLKEKDEQLERLDRRFAEAQILHADTKKMLTSGQEDNNISSKYSKNSSAKNFFSRIFRKKNETAK